MLNDDNQQFRREMNMEIMSLQRQLDSFKTRTGVIANLFVPGLGYLVKGKGLIKGIVSFILYALLWYYLVFTSFYSNEFLYMIAILVIIVLIIVSTAMVPGA